MRRLLYILLMLVVAGAFSCRRGERADEERLIAIDSLIATAPDSALALLDGMRGDSLPQPLQAYRDLLVTQAMYKAYLTATSDSLIARAWGYYRDHGPYDRRIRALLYSGTVAEELGRPDSAMRWYKRTELESHADDHYHRGYAFMSLGMLCQNTDLSLRNAKKSYRSALMHFEALNDTNLLLFCYTQIGRLFQAINSLDSAIYFSSKALNLSYKVKDSLYINENLTNICGAYFLAKNYAAVTNTAHQILSTNNLSEDQLITCLYYLCHTYTDLERADSARYYLQLMPAPKDFEDSLKFNRITAEIARVEKDLSKYIQANTLNEKLTDSVFINNRVNNLDLVESEISNEELTAIIDKTKKQRQLLEVIIIVILVSLISFVIIQKIILGFKLSSVNQEICRIINQLNEQNKRLERSQIEARIKYQAYNEQVNSIRNFFETLLHAAPQRSSSLRANLNSIIISENDWNIFCRSVDILLNGFVSQLSDKYRCGKNTIRVFCFCFCGGSNNLVELCLPYKRQSIANIKQRIAHRVLGSDKNWTDLLEYLKIEQ